MSEYSSVLPLDSKLKDPEPDSSTVPKSMSRALAKVEKHRIVDARSACILIVSSFLTAGLRVGRRKKTYKKEGEIGEAERRRPHQDSAIA